MDNYKFDTLAIHAGYSPDATGSRAAPLYMTSAYSFRDTEHSRRLFALEEAGNIYTRIMNPTTDILEQRMAALEGGIGALAAASGHSAMTMMFMNLARAGDEIISAANIYGGAKNLMKKTFGQLGIEFKFADHTDPADFERLITDKTRAIFVESMGNPRGDICDLEAIAAVAKRHGLPFIVDNTVATSALLRPIQHGADLVVYSTTKYVSGNGTVMGGIVIDAGTFEWKGNPRFPDFNTPDESYHGVVYADACGKAAFITKMRTHILRDIGACQSPFNAWVTLLGMETLSLRMKRHSESALAIAQWLEKQSDVSNISYPALASSNDYALSQKYLPNGASSMFCFDITGGRERAAKFCDALKLISIVTNLGDSRTLVSCPACTTHSQLSDSELSAAGINPGLVRIGVGLEDVDDLTSDLAQALEISR